MRCLRCWVEDILGWGGGEEGIIMLENQEKLRLFSSICLHHPLVTGFIEVVCSCFFQRVIQILTYEEKE